MEGSISSLSFVEAVAPEGAMSCGSGRALLRMHVDAHTLALNAFVKPLVRYEYVVEF
jgi:hypothetical protein